MYKKTFILVVAMLLFSLRPPITLAITAGGQQCDINNDTCDIRSGWYCQTNPIPGTTPNYYCQKAITGGSECDPQHDACDKTSGYSCQSNPVPNATLANYCQKIPAGTTQDVFGKIKVPDALRSLVNDNADPSGAQGLSRFFSNLVALFYSIAGIVLIFMIVWGAFDWLTSEGDKEKVQSAQKKIINAIIGIILFAITFAVIQVLGHFTGFTFFAGQKP